MLGVLGGMGPLATVDFLDKLVRSTAATCDQEHVPVLVASLPQIPDRTRALVAGGADPLPAMLDGVRRLRAAGADLIAIPCNTAHAWHGRIAAEAGVPVLHIVEAVLTELRTRGIEAGDVGLLATEATVAAAFYQAALGRAGLRAVAPADQRAVTAGIRAVKAGDLAGGRDRLAAAALRLFSTGCRAIILGCTEISAALHDTAGLPGEVIDASTALARTCIVRAGFRATPTPR